MQGSISGPSSAHSEASTLSDSSTVDILRPTITCSSSDRFGASSVLIYGIINSPLAQPGNLIGGHVICALVGVTCHKLVPDLLWLSAALSVAWAIVLMQVTKTLHPPGGATALIANIGSPKIQALGYFYVISPVLSGC